MIVAKVTIAKEGGGPEGPPPWGAGIESSGEPFGTKVRYWDGPAVLRFRESERSRCRLTREPSKELLFLIERGRG